MLLDRTQNLPREGTTQRSGSSRSPLTAHRGRNPSEPPQPSAQHHGPHPRPQSTAGLRRCAPLPDLHALPPPLPPALPSRPAAAPPPTPSEGCAALRQRCPAEGRPRRGEGRKEDGCGAAQPARFRRPAPGLGPRPTAPPHSLAAARPPRNASPAQTERGRRRAPGNPAAPSPSHRRSPIIRTPSLPVAHEWHHRRPIAARWHIATTRRLVRHGRSPFFPHQSERGAEGRSRPPRLGHTHTDARSAPPAPPPSASRRQQLGGGSQWERRWRCRRAARRGNNKQRRFLLKAQARRLLPAPQPCGLLTPIS